MLKGINHQNFSVDGTKSNIIKETLKISLPTSQINLLIAKKSFNVASVQSPLSFCVSIRRGHCSSGSRHIVQKRRTLSSCIVQNRPSTSDNDALLCSKLFKNFNVIQNCSNDSKLFRVEQVYENDAVLRTVSLVSF